MICRCESPAATEELGARLAAILAGGDVVTLEAPLGGGKTTLARGICRGMEVPEEQVSSPTFVLLHIYPGRVPVHHFDLYRLRQPEELHAIGAEDYLWGEGVCLVEWPKLAERLLPPDRLDIQLDYDADGDPEARQVTLTGRGAWEERLRRWPLSEARA